MEKRMLRLKVVEARLHFEREREKKILARLKNEQNWRLFVFHSAKKSGLCSPTV